MKKFKKSKKKRTYKKYNKAQFRRFNKHINLTSKMKGGGIMSPFRRKESHLKGKEIMSQFRRKELETLLENITNDTTFDLAGSPLGRPLYEDTTQERAIERVQNALDDYHNTSDKEIEELDSYIWHYSRRRIYENAFKYGRMIAETQTDSTPYSERIIRVQNLLQNINDDKPEQKDWLKTYLGFLQKSTYISYTQERRIEAMLAGMEYGVEN